MQVRVPGKVMLSGEYAVLYGGTAVLVPVPRYLTVSAVDEPDLNETSPVISEALKEPIHEISGQEQDLSPLHVHVDRSEFTHIGSDGVIRKLGLGGSAAEAVAVIGLRFERCGFDWTTIPKKIQTYADLAHRRAQGGLGSGADVAAIAYRQPIRFRRDEGRSYIEVIEKPASHLIPKLTLLWTGESANTRELVARFQDWANSFPNSEALINILVLEANRLAEEWFSTEYLPLFHALGQFGETLSSLSGLADLPWRLPVHMKLAEWAYELGGRAKPTGAGGGDMILLVGDLPTQHRSELTIQLDPFNNL